MESIFHPKVKIEIRHACQECGLTYSRPYRLKLHQDIVHKNLKQFVCGEPNCKKNYSNKSHLDRHIRTAHMERENNVIYSCHKCVKVYANRQNLKRHLKIHHGKPMFTCDVCKKKFKKKHLLSGHMYEHTMVKSFSCDLCSAEFITLAEKKKHQKRHKTYSCDQCDMAFVQWSKYLKHKRTVHTSKEYICDVCGRKFKKRSHMVHHFRIHSCPTFFSCTYKNCDRVYSRYNNLKHHKKIKHLSVKYECDICSAKLSTKGRLKVHREKHNMPKANIVWPTKETGRKDRRDKGASKSSTALKIAGLLVDPENEISPQVENGKFLEVPVIESKSNEIIEHKM